MYYHKKKKKIIWENNWDRLLLPHGCYIWAIQYECPKNKHHKCLTHIRRSSEPGLKFLSLGLIYLESHGTSKIFFLDFVDIIILKNNKNNSILIYFQVNKYFKK
jgi:hypothetical protein